MNSQTRTIAMTAIILFALAGLISGFTFGAFAHTNKAQQATNPTPVPTHPATQPTAIPTQTQQTQQPVLLGIPKIQIFTRVETADNTTNYTFSAKIVDKKAQLVTAANVTCKIWLTTDGVGAIRQMLTANDSALLKNIDTFASPFPDEEQNSLTFTQSSQTQSCNPAGATSWKYTINPDAVKKGTNFMVVLADWKGIHYNWNIIEIFVTKDNQ